MEQHGRKRSYCTCCRPLRVDKQHLPRTGTAVDSVYGCFMCLLLCLCTAPFGATRMWRVPLLFKLLLIRTLHSPWLLAAALLHRHWPPARCMGCSCFCARCLARLLLAHQSLTLQWLCGGAFCWELTLLTSLIPLYYVFLTAGGSSRVFRPPLCVYMKVSRGWSVQRQRQWQMGSPGVTRCRARQCHLPQHPQHKEAVVAGARRAETVGCCQASSEQGPPAATGAKHRPCPTTTCTSSSRSGRQQHRQQQQQHGGQGSIRPVVAAEPRVVWRSLAC